MTFEEFFKKKKIALDALQGAEPGLFAEFKTHYGQMGEKSFDHTKKYWFNKLRRQFPLPPEVKAEKLRMESQIAEQTVTETLTEPTDVKKLGFNPKFKTAMSTRSASPPPATDEPVNTNKPAAETSRPVPQNDAIAEAPTKASPTGFKPRFKAGVTNTAKPAEETTTATPEKVEEDIKSASAETGDVVKPAPTGFKPRFKAGITQTKPTEAPAEPALKEESSAEPEKPAGPLGFKPRFKSTAPATPEVKTEEQTAENDKPEPDEKKPAEKPAYKPRFNMKNIQPKPPENE